GAHLCKYAAYVGSLRGWGRGLRSAVADWYTSKPIQELATQILKHRHRKGWSHRDLLRLSHPKPPTPDHNALFQWAVEGKLGHLTEAGLIAPESAATALVVMRLVDRTRIRRANVHPAALLSALVKYRTGPWKASPIVADALEDALHISFNNVEPTGKRLFLGI